MSDHVLSGGTVLLFSLCSMAGAEISLDSKDYVPVDWNVADLTTETATGTLSGFDVVFEPGDLVDQTIFSADYSNDVAFDALTIDPDEIESVRSSSGADRLNSDPPNGSSMTH